jgi:hypothetical protein
LKLVKFAFIAGYSAIALLFFVCALALVVFAGMEMWHGISPGEALQVRARFNSILEAIALLTIAVAAMELGQTVLEEEIQRSTTQLSAPTRVRRFVSRFLVVIVVALSIETLVGVFRLLHEDPSQLPNVAAIGVAAAALLAAWGIFVKLNTDAEVLEPHGLEEVKQEDHDVEAAEE